MTATARATLARRTGRRRLVTMAADLHEAGLYELKLADLIRFPSERYQRDPLAFFRDVLGVEPWARATDLITAVRDHDRVAVKAGRKVAKSHTVAGLALWFYCSFPDARVIMTSTTAQQVERVLWREITMMYARSGRCLTCKTADPNGTRIPRPCPHSAAIDGDLGMLPHTGLKVHDLGRGDFREIYGFTAKQGEAVQGMSGTRMMYIIDEASGIADFIYEAIEGNRAGGAKVILTGNPTKTEGEFFEAFGPKKLDPDDPESTGYVGITISSEESPNVVHKREIIRGLATLGFIREREKEWGRDSPLFKIHVLGQFAMNEDGRIFSVAKIKTAEDLWEYAPSQGRLYVGLDPAGATGTGDESCFAIRRGVRVEELLTFRGLNADGHLAQLVGILKERRVGREVPVVVMDRSGSIGAELYGRLCAFLDTHRDGIAPFDLVGVRGSDRAQRQPEVYDTVRDELAASLEQAMLAGLAIPTDPKLAAELHALEWKQQVNGRLKVTPKDVLRKVLKRSPDRADAVQLACWEELSLSRDVPASAPESATATKAHEADGPDTDDARAEDAWDPYADRDR